MNLHSIFIFSLLVLSSAGLGASTAQLTKAEQDYKKGEQYHLGDGVVQDLDMALRYYKRALDQEPDLFHALFNTAHIYFAREQYKHATGFFIKAAKAARQDKSVENEAQARSNLGTCYLKDDRVDKAEKQFRAAIKLAPSLVEAHHNLLTLLVEEERWDEAEKALKRAEQSAPSSKYKLIRGKIKSGISRLEWESLEIQVVTLGLLVGILGYWLYKKLRAG